MKCPSCNEEPVTKLAIPVHALRCSPCGWVQLEEIRLPSVDDINWTESVGRGMPILNADACSMCGRPMATDRKLIVGINGAICAECVAMCSDVLREVAENSNPRESAD
jgi:hypothetical protein